MNNMQSARQQVRGKRWASFHSAQLTALRSILSTVQITSSQLDIVDGMSDIKHPSVSLLQCNLAAFHNFTNAISDIRFL